MGSSQQTNTCPGVKGLEGAKGNMQEGCPLEVTLELKFKEHYNLPIKKKKSGGKKKQPGQQFKEKNTLYF